MDSQNLGTLNYKASGAIAEKTFVEVASASAVKTFDGTGYPLGVATMNAEDTQSVGVQTRGSVRVVAGAAVAVGAPVTSNSSGKAITATGGADVHGVALTACSNANEVITVCLDVKGTTAA